MKLAKTIRSGACAILCSVAALALARPVLAEGAAPASADPAATSKPPQAVAPAPSGASDQAQLAALDALDASESSSYWDPIEPVNRVILDFNELADRYVIGPISQAYGFIVPDPAERAVRRAFRNLSEPISFANHFVQFHPEGAGRSLVRFCVNSTVGVAGLFDVANKLGLAPIPTDFGGTLYRYGMPAGPYIVEPLLGPSTARDTIGGIVDDAVMPQRYLPNVVQLLLLSGNGITARREADDGLNALRDGAVDFYAALRSAYYFNRESELRAGDAPGASEIFRSSAAISASNPSRSNTDVYSDLRSASSETVPLK